MWDNKNEKSGLNIKVTEQIKIKINIWNKENLSKKSTKSQRR